MEYRFKVLVVNLESQTCSLFVGALFLDPQQGTESKTSKLNTGHKSLLLESELCIRLSQMTWDFLA